MRKQGETKRESLIRRLSEYMEFADTVKRYSDYGFYEELHDFLLNGSYEDDGILRGKDAERFVQRMEECNQGMHKVSAEEFQRAKKTYESIIERSTM